MSLQDPIADMLTRIRNALSAHQKVTNVRASNVCEGVCQTLKGEGYILDYQRVDATGQGLLRVYLKYGPNGEAVVNEIKRISRPGRRVYRGAADLPKVMNGLGIAIVSTSRGVMSDRRCREEKVGGEVLASIC